MTLGGSPPNVYRAWGNFSLFLKGDSFPVSEISPPRELGIQAHPGGLGVYASPVKGALWKCRSREMCAKYGMNRESPFFQSHRENKDFSEELPQHRFLSLETLLVSIVEVE